MDLEKIDSDIILKADNIFIEHYEAFPNVLKWLLEVQKSLGKNLTFTLLRQSIKDHGDKGSLLGYQYKGGENVIAIAKTKESKPSLASYKIKVLASLSLIN